MNFVVAKPRKGTSGGSTGFQRQLYIVENVEAEVCTACGERYFHAKTLDAVDALLLKQHAVKEILCVEVVEFTKAAA